MLGGKKKCEKQLEAEKAAARQLMEAGRSWWQNLFFVTTVTLVNTTPATDHPLRQYTCTPAGRPSDGLDRCARAGLGGRDTVVLVDGRINDDVHLRRPQSHDPRRHHQFLGRRAREEHRDEVARLESERLRRLWTMAAEGLRC